MIRRHHFTQVFSFDTLNEYRQWSASAAPLCPPTVSVYLPDPRNPKRYQPVTRDRMRERTYSLGLIHCSDIQTLEAVRTLVLSNLEASLLLLIHCCKNAEFPRQSVRLIITIDVDHYDRYESLSQHFAWARRLWTLAARAHIIAFTGVYFSVLGGAYCSLGKTNTSYAHKAKALATRQIQLARWLKDSDLECKCWLYYAEDLIQLGQLKQATKIINNQIAFANRCHGTVLLKICDSVVLKLAVKRKSKSELRSMVSLLPTYLVEQRR